jgi:uncharacterized iron-regulated protein
MRKLTLLLALCLISFSAFAQKPAYVIYNEKGKKVKYSKMLKTLAEQDIVMFGELHNNAIAHWLEYEVTVDLNEEKTLVLGAEMIEADNQVQLNQYLTGEIDQEGLDTLARLWPNYDTDYAPLVDYAKDNQIPFVATNIPRRYASLVYRNGFEVLDTLDAGEKAWIAPLPILYDPELESYQNILSMMGEHGTPELVMAQAIKDATMSHFILENLGEGNLFIHYNGAYHSDNYEGIVWYLKQANPELKIATISTVSQADIEKLEDEYLDVANFIIVVDENMTNTY